MSDNHVRYKAIRKALEKPYSAQPQGNFARHLNTLAGLISGIVGSKNSNLPEIASMVPDGAKRESRVKRHTRWLQNNNIDANAYYTIRVGIIDKSDSVFRNPHISDRWQCDRARMCLFNGKRHL